MNLPTAVTLSRVLLVPLFIFLVEKHPVWGCLIFVLASLTDLLDGYLARRSRQVTKLGIITDGDIRRGLEREQADFLLRTAEEVMTRGPKTTLPDALAAEALALMEKHAITSIVVVADESRIQGVIHLHDLLKAGIV